MMNHPSIAHLETKYTSPVLSSQYCVSCGALALPGWYLCEGCCSAAVAQIPTTCGAAPPAAACAPQMMMSSGDYWSERSSSDPSSNASVAGYASFPSPSLYDSYSIHKNAMPQFAHESPAVPCSNCACCGKTLDANRAFASTCSMRCEWVYRWSCPQCGRYRASEPYHEQPYCSAGCASQSHQANWCPSCGVRQILNGLTHCSTACASKAHGNFPIRPRKKIAHLNSALRHDVMSEKERHSLLQPLRHVFADHSAVVVNVVKCNPNTLRRKQYLTYRASVEQMMSSTGRTTKYGFGGEGNEQRRFVPLTMSCAMGEAGNPFALAGATVECCDNKRCNACVCLRNGMSMVHLGALSHYCTADLELSLLHAISLKNPGSLGAVGVCRAVIGVPAFVKDPSHIVAGAENTHSTIITAADPKHEGTYVFRDDAIELQYIILFQ